MAPPADNVARDSLRQTWRIDERHAVLQALRLLRCNHLRVPAYQQGWHIGPIIPTTIAMMPVATIDSLRGHSTHWCGFGLHRSFGRAGTAARDISARPIPIKDVKSFEPATAIERQPRVSARA
jgi:hypothetical protein